MKLGLWLITGDPADTYDVYDSAVVAAFTADEAKRIHPSGNLYDRPEDWGGPYSSWVAPDKVTAVRVGDAADDVKPGTVLCASFYAG